MVKDVYTFFHDIKFGLMTFDQTAQEIAGYVVKGEIHIYQAAFYCSEIIENFRRAKFFASPRRGSLMLKRMLATIEDQLSRCGNVPVSAQKIPEHLLDNSFFSLGEALALLGEPMVPISTEYPMGTAYVHAIEEKMPGNFRLGLFWGKTFDVLVWIDKPALQQFKLPGKPGVLAPGR